jgi:hypothetical protein
MLEINETGRNGLFPANDKKMNQELPLRDAERTTRFSRASLTGRQVSASWRHGPHRCWMVEITPAQRHRDLPLGAVQLRSNRTEI